MKIHEYQGKEIFKKYGIPVPKSNIAKTPEEVRYMTEDICKKVVIKAQVHIGGRGKAGGIKIANSPDEAFNIANEILEKKLKGLTVKKVLVEEALSISQEFYLAITMDRSSRKNILIASCEGGVDIEEVALRNPEKIEKLYIDPAFGIQNFEIKKISFKLNFPKFLEKEFYKLIKTLYKVYIECDATLVEINPLVITGDKKLIAADAKILLDDNAIFRHKEFETLQEIAEDDEIEREARKRKVPYVRLDGDIGIMGNGAGLVMSTIDMVNKEGGKAANFLDIGGGAGAEKVINALEIITSDKNINGLYLNIFGGITRCDEVAKGIIEAIEKLNIKIPVVIRLAGTKEEEGRKILEEAGFEVGRDMNEGAGKIVKLARKYGEGREKK